MPLTNIFGGRGIIIKKGKVVPGQSGEENRWTAHLALVVFHPMFQCLMLS